MNKLYHLYNEILSKKRLLIQVMTRMNFKNIMLREAGHKRVNTVRLHLYEIPVQGKLIYSKRK